MKNNYLFYCNTRVLLLALILLSLTTLSVSADVLKESIDIDKATNSAAIKSQNKIDKLSDQTQKMLNEYRSANHQIESLRIYNSHLQDLLKSQAQEKLSLTQQLEQIEITQREIVPLILNMLDNLEKFVQLDLPFLLDERLQRIAKLKTMVTRADVTNAEKYRRILEAYQIENEYGNTIEAYRANIQINGKSYSVDNLRLGRVELYYQRLDGSETGHWNQQQNQWQVLSNDYKNAIRKGLRIARKETAPDLLTLPVSAPEAAQ